MDGNVGVSRPDRRRRWCAQSQEALVDLLVNEIDRHFALEFQIKPGHQASNLGPFDGAFPEQWGLGLDLLEILTNRGGIDDHLWLTSCLVGFDQHRHFAGRVKSQKILATFPDFFDFQLEGELLLGQHDSNLACERAKPEMIEGPHSAATLAEGPDSGEDPDAPAENAANAHGLKHE